MKTVQQSREFRHATEVAIIQTALRDGICLFRANLALTSVIYSVRDALPQFLASEVVLIEPAAHLEVEALF